MLLNKTKKKNGRQLANVFISSQLKHVILVCEVTVCNFSYATMCLGTTVLSELGANNDVNLTCIANVPAQRERYDLNFCAPERNGCYVG